MEYDCVTRVVTPLRLSGFSMYLLGVLARRGTFFVRRRSYLRDLSVCGICITERRRYRSWR